MQERRGLRSAPHQNMFAGGEREELLRSKRPTVQGGEPCRGADLRERRDPRGSGGVVPKLRVAAETGLESNLFSQVPRRELCPKVRPVVKIRVTSLDTRATQVRILPWDLSHVAEWLKAPKRTFVADSPAD